jgi:hypothetical protein
MQPTAHAARLGRSRDWTEFRIGMWVAVTGHQGAGGWLAAEREDGTLPRAKAAPQGMEARRLQHQQRV